jgi:hypothetical protein
MGLRFLVVLAAALMVFAVETEKVCSAGVIT